MNLKIKVILLVVSFLMFIFGSFFYLSLQHLQENKRLLEAGIKREGESLITATKEALSITLPSRDYFLVKKYGKELVRERENITLYQAG